jgi:hypothetical protein
MKKSSVRPLVRVVAAVAVFASVVFPSAQAQTVTFSNINDAARGRYFDSATSAPDPANPNRLVIGFNTGIDPRTWVYNTFTASTASFYRGSAMDTISFFVTAPEGYAIAKITYTQGGTGSIARSGKASGGTQLVVQDFTADLGIFGTNPTLAYTLTLDDHQPRTGIPVSVTTSLFAWAPPGLGSATVSVTSAAVEVELERLP